MEKNNSNYEYLKALGRGGLIFFISAVLAGIFGGLLGILTQNFLVGLYSTHKSSIEFQQLTKE